MGFIKAALSAGISSFQDSKFKEAITLPEAVPATALAIKGQLLTKDPDGRSRQSNQNTGLLTDGSVVIVPQGHAGSDRLRRPHLAAARGRHAAQNRCGGHHAG